MGKKILRLANLLGCFAFIVWANLCGAENSINARFVPDASSAALNGQWALWQNPAGLGFFTGSENSLGYLYEFNTLGNRHHGGANWALNVWEAFSLAFALNTRASCNDLARKNFGTDLTGIFGSAIKFGTNTAIGISFMKTHSFLNNKSTSTMVSLGFQTRPASFLSLGGLYQEVHEGFFQAPNITLGLAVRPLGEQLTLAFDGRWTAINSTWGNARFDPIFGIKGERGGLAASITTEIPGIKDGWHKPIFSLGLAFNFAHLGLNLSGHINKAAKIYGLGASIRGSTAEWASLASPTGLWVNLSIGPDGELESKSRSFTARLLEEEPGPLAVLALLKRLKSDPIIAGVIIQLEGFSFGDARAQEWRNALVDLRRANKEVIIYLASPSERDYYVATAANKIYMNPYATLSLLRFQTTLVYFADLLKKIGVQAEAISAGNYKTATRPFTKSVAQKEEIEVYSHILQSFYESLLDESAQARNITKEKLKEIFDLGEISATAAKEYGLVDELIFKDQIEEKQENNNGGQNPTIFEDYQHRTVKRTNWAPVKKVAVIPIVGEIVTGRVFPTLLPLFGLQSGAKDVEDEIESAADDPDVAAIIVRIDSPGGDSAAGEAIHRALIKAREKKPVVASMSDVAASAGYMVAVACDRILTEKNTLTGSIGVFSLHFSAGELAKKIGVNPTELSTIKNSGPNNFRIMSKSERQQAQKIVDWVYQNFISVVATSLNLEEALVRENADGRIWLGFEALAKKLVNEIGGFSEAIDTARTLADLPADEELQIELNYPGQSKALTLSGRLASALKSPSLMHEISELVPFARPYIKALDAYRLAGVPQARLPFDIVRMDKKSSF